MGVTWSFLLLTPLFDLLAVEEPCRAAMPVLHNDTRTTVGTQDRPENRHNELAFDDIR